MSEYSFFQMAQRRHRRPGEETHGRTQNYHSSSNHNLLQFQFEVTLPEIERIDRGFIFKLGLCFHDLVEDLLTELVQEDLTLVLRVSLVLNNIDVRVEGKFTLCLRTISLFASVPLFHSSRFSSPTGSLPPMVVKEFSMYQPPGPWKGVGEQFDPGEIFSIGCGENRMTTHIHFQPYPSLFSRDVRLLLHQCCFLSQLLLQVSVSRLQRRLLEIIESHCVTSY